jgi:hypothetical protein
MLAGRCGVDDSTHEMLYVDAAAPGLDCYTESHLPAALHWLWGLPGILPGTGALVQYE